MNAKKVVGKAVVGAIVAVVLAAGIVVAQKSPYGSVENPGDDVKQKSDKLDIQFNVDLRAILMAIQNPGDDQGGFTIGLEDIQNPADPNEAVGNVGWVVLESNASAWDILVRRQNGGYLVRKPNAGETKLDTVGGYVDITNCRDSVIGGVWGSVENVCDTNTIGGTVGIALKYVPAGETKAVPVPLSFGVGVLKKTAIPTKAGMEARVKAQDPNYALFGVPLLFKDQNGDDQDFASFAYSIKDSIDNESGSGPIGSEVSTYFDATDWNAVATAMGTNPNIDASFPQIKTGQILALDSAYGGEVYKPRPATPDGTMGFFVNATLDYDKYLAATTGTSGSCSDGTSATETICLAVGSCSDGTSATETLCTGASGTWTSETWTPAVPATSGRTAGGRLSGNRNGVYEESLIFTFYGNY